MQLETLPPQVVVESMNPPLRGHKQKLIDAVAFLSMAKFDTKKATHDSLFRVSKCRIQKPKTRRKKKMEVLYFSVGILMKGGNFDVYDSSNPAIYYPPEDFLLRRESTESIVIDKTRWFSDLDETKDYACMSLVFHRPYLFANVSSLWELLLVSDPPFDNRLESPSNSSSVDTISCFNVLTHSKNRKRPLPHMVCVRYLKGGLAYYLVNDIGRIDSQMIVRLPRSKAIRKSAATGKEATLEYIAIVGHSMAKGKRKAISLCVLWSDGAVTDEPLQVFGKDNYYSVYRYALENGLQNQSGWKRYGKCNSGKKVVITPFIQEDGLQERRPAIDQMMWPE
jgi:hypothetical protein